jgi:hypothetical protein
MLSHANDKAFGSDTSLTKLEFFTIMIAQGLISKYHLTIPSDQQTIAQLSVELAKSIIDELNS